MNAFAQFTADYRAALATRALGRASELHETLDSTNAYLKRRLAAGDAPEGLAAVALTQTAGRGRLGRAWESEPGAGLYVSFVTPAVPGGLLPLVPIAVGVAVAQACRSLTGADAGVKWPNDVIVRDRKLSGILCEGVRGRAVCGIGVNLAQDAAFFRARRPAARDEPLFGNGTRPERGTARRGDCELPGTASRRPSGGRRRGAYPGVPRAVRQYRARGTRCFAARRDVRTGC